MQDSENSGSQTNESAPSIEPSPTSSASPFIPHQFGVRELTATYEMIVKSKQAIRLNEHWAGEELEPMAMLLSMLTQMEGQYRAQLDQARAQEKEALKRTREAIHAAGGQTNGVAIGPIDHPAA